jgi:hypothetical protein
VSTKNRGGDVHSGQDVLAGQSTGVVGSQRLSAQAKKEKRISF